MNRKLEQTSTPLVSVIVGAYNHAHYVQECLDSILSSTYPEIELVIFNDASTDETSNIITEWLRTHSHKRTKFIDHQLNIGLTRSLNEAIGNASGDFICLTAADDVLLSEGISDRVAYLQGHPGKLAVFADSHIIDNNGYVIADSAIEGYFKHHGMSKELLKTDALMPYNIVFHWAVPGPVFLCHKRAFEVVGLYDEQSVAEDFDMYLRLAARGVLGFCDSYVSSYRKHVQSMTANQFDEVQAFLAESGYKNRKAFGAICQLKLTASWYGLRARRSRGRLQRLSLLGIHKALLLFSWRTYLIRRWLILRGLKDTDSGTAK